MHEIFRTVEGHADYEVSNLGRVYSNKTHKYLSPGYSKRGYARVKLDGKTVLLHRLVAIAFIPNPDNLPQINHRDCDPSNNVVSNLEWCDSVYNNNYGDRNKKAGEAIAKALTGKPHSQEHREAQNKLKIPYPVGTPEYRHYYYINYWKPKHLI